MALLQKILRKPVFYSLLKKLCCWLALFVLLFYSSFASALEPPPAITTLTVEDGLLTVKATHVPLSEILTRICQAAGIETRLQSRLASPVSVSFKDISLEEGLLRLTKGYSTALFYRSEKSAPAEKTHHNIVKIWVSGTKKISSTTSESNIQLIQSTNEDTSLTASHGKPSGVDLARETTLPTALSPVDQTEEDSDGVAYWSQVLDQNPDPEQLKLAIVSLARIGSEAALSAMATTLGNKEAAVRQLVVENLGLVDSDRSTQLLGQVMFSDPDPKIRLQAVQQLALQNNEASVAFLTDAAQKQGGEIGASARKFLESRSVAE